MPNTPPKSIFIKSIQLDEYKKSNDETIQFYPVAESKRKQVFTDRIKAIGEELLAWMLTISATTAAVLLIQFVLNII